MKLKDILLLTTLCGLPYLASAQITGFEQGIPQQFSTSKGSKLAPSTTYYKEGQQSLAWNYLPKATLHIALEQPLTLDDKLAKNGGIMLWVYNEKPQQDSIRFEFLTPQGEVAYRFGFRLAAAGWRACWIGFSHMKTVQQSRTLASYRLTAPDTAGRIFLDRLTFPVQKMNDRTTPDQQMPTNNSLSYRDLWHWCRVWQWEQYTYDLPLPASLTAQQQAELKQVEERLTQLTDVKQAPQKSVDAAYKTFRKAQIQPSGKGFTGAPIVAPDELNRKQGEMSWNDLETMLSGFAYDAYYNHSQTALKHYFTVWKYAIDQGFAFGSGMGTNHHYGYQVRKIYTTAWLLRDAIRQHPDSQRILQALTFWSALQETRKPYQYGRDELLDSWHTLLTAKAVAALLQPNLQERSRALQGLSRWVSTSLQYTPGTIGGIKVDGTTFHHGGFYPAYTTGVLAHVGQFVHLTAHTSYQVTLPARQVLKQAFLAMRNYSNPYEWGIGISGRHPFGGSMKEDDIEAFAYLALAGDLSGQGNTFDHQLAADYLRLCRKPTAQARYFRQQGIKPAAAPHGFFVYNYGSAGIFRQKEWMVTLKGYTTDVWGAEIYKKDNRYGRYQSYGSVQIMGQPSRQASGYVQQGWDWNRLPGTTTIHLPFELLDAPFATTMAHATQDFSGCTTLDGQNGLFAMNLTERDMKNFTPDFVAHKSVFCWGNRMVCLGTDISNSNSKYPTETTLFQSVADAQHPIWVEGLKQNQVGYQRILTATDSQPVHLQDGYGNHYYVRQGKIHTQIALQESRHEKTRAVTQGTFASAWIDHGITPQQANYEYMVVIQPDSTDTHSPLQSYRVERCDSQAHIVTDLTTGITGYAAFQQTHGTGYLLQLPAETLIMCQPKDKQLQLSVCDPNLHIREKSYTTKEASQPSYKELILNGHWTLQDPDQRLKTTYQAEQTVVTVRCQHGQPVVFTLTQGIQNNPSCASTAAVK